MVVAGNSTMRDLFFRLNVHSIGQNPYRSITEIEMAEGKRATTSLTQHGPPLPACRFIPKRAFRARRSSAAMWARMPPPACSPSIWRMKRGSVAIMDIGTNTELIVGNRDRFSPPPARPDRPLKAARSPAACRRSKAPSKTCVSVTPARFHLSVIGGGAPEGICGSGLVALLSELLRTGRMNEMGRFEEMATASNRSRSTASISWKAM